MTYSTEPTDYFIFTTVNFNSLAKYLTIVILTFLHNAIMNNSVKFRYENTLNEQGRREGGGQIAPGPEVLGGPWNFFVGPQSFLWVKYFRAKDKIWAKYRNLVWGGGGLLSEIMLF